MLFMKRKTVSAITLILLLASMLTLAFNIQPVKASGTIYIRADGSVDPPTAPIQRDERIYTFTGNTNDSIVVQRSNIIIDGAGCALQGPGSGNGFYLSGINNVTIKGTNVKGFDWGIGLSAGASYNTILGNNITGNYGGVHLSWSSGNVLRNNSMINNDYNFMVVGYAISHFVQDIDTSNTVDGKPIYYWVSRENIEVPSDAGYVALVNSTNITVKGLRLKNNGQGILLAYTTNAQIVNNNLTNNYYGIALLYSSNNNIYRNDITNNSWCGVWLECSSDNRLCHNNFISNQYHVYFSVGPSINTWDDGYPSGGNYWSDYTGVDADGDGICDTPYVIDANNQDHYPLMHPWSPLPVHNINTGLGYAKIQQAINADETLNGHTIFVEAGTYYENTVVNKTVSLIGESQDTTIIDGGGFGKVITVIVNNTKISGFTIQQSQCGVYLLSVYKNALTNNRIASNGVGIYLESCSYDMLVGNNISDNTYGILGWYLSDNEFVNNYVINGSVGIDLKYSSNNTFLNNKIKNNSGTGFSLLYDSPNNTLMDNEIANNGGGIILQSGSSNNSLTGNNVTNNNHGIWLETSFNNKIYHNNFVNNGDQVQSIYSTNTWDNGYPSGGNYWSDYNGTDFYSGPYQNETGSDGQGDTPYFIDADNRDGYPLMHPWSSLPVHNMNTGLGYVAIQEAINANETLDGHTIFVEAGIYNENVVVNKTVSLTGENRETTIIDGKGIGNVVSITVYNVTVSDFKIQNSGTEYNAGIYFFNASSTLGNVTVRNNNLTNNYYGVNVFSSFNVLLVGNNIANNEKAGVNLEQSFRNTVISNNVTANIEFGIVLYCADHNTLSDNNIKNNKYGIYVHCSSNNKIYHNNFIDNSNQTYVEGYMNIWDDGYSSGGNYWSDYGGADLYRGPYQNETGRDGIGDIPCVIDTDNQDNYPLMPPYVPVLGDLNQDGIVNILDAIQAASAFGSYPGHPKWNEQADINRDGVVNILDVIILANNFGKHSF